MTEATQQKVNSQGATAENLDDGQGIAGAPKEPKVNNGPTTEVSTAGAVSKETATIVETTSTVQSQTETQSTEAKVANDWPEFQDDALKASASVFKEAGLDYATVKGAFAKTAETGKLEDVDVPALEAKLGKEKAALALIGIKDYYNRQVAQVAETVKAVHTVFGGEQAFEKAKAWAVDKAKTDQAFASDLTKYRDMFNAGGVSARAAARDLLQAYNAAPDTSGVKTKMINGDKTVQVGASETPLSRSDYMKLYKDAHAKKDYAEIKRLDTRRRAGIKAKI